VTAHGTSGTERTLGRVLTVGTRVSTALLAIGLMAEGLRAHAIAAPLLHAGLVALMATPVLRVAVSIAAFARRSEWWMVASASTVLVLLIAGILVAFLS
jgi:uncharacterized membrane protein